ncbi:hypothetical protein EDB81DRAFT_353293 [Dactylonectria macrodidyma]|uniref:Uncharacterized protein n=1 Tax=Dactylonectria macrodidyma TaxID=307937 RepID=A0A9P9FGU6_9HYPO|nr:hypothetical protein EDB81DRAFT_353293 [Dactylonectria macrodidyma]
MDFIEETLSSAMDGQAKEIIELRRVLNSARYYRTTFRSLATSWSDLCKDLKALQINAFNLAQLSNSIFVRTNTISIRRLGEQNFLEAEEWRALTIKSAKDAGEMKSIATLTMHFVSSTVVSTFFSTPFMNLDDGLNFNALSKV